MCFTLTAVGIHAAPLGEGPQIGPPSQNGNVGSGPVGPATDLPVLPQVQAPGFQVLADGNGNRLSDGLEALLDARASDELVDVIVTFSNSGNAASAQRSVGAFRVNREFSIISGFAATVTVNQARGLAQVSGIFRVEADAMAYANLEAARRDFGVDALLFYPTDPESQTPTGVDIHVCVLDTGIQADQEQFKNETGTRVDGFIDLVGDFFGVIDPLTGPYDDHGHGTHVSGIIGGDGVAASGGDPILAPRARGVAPDIVLHVAKVLDYNGSGPDSGIIAGLEWCLDQGVYVVNLSLGIPGSSDGNDALSAAVDAAVASGVTVVVAAGNAGDDEKTIGSPGAAAGAITVGAVAEHTESTTGEATSFGVYPAPFSSRGPTQDGRTKPDISGPGVTILSAMTNVVAVDPDPIFGGGGIVDLGCGLGCYAIASGTSMASPFVAGTVALMLEADPGLSPDDIRRVLTSTARERGAAGMDDVLGRGLVDVEAAVWAVLGTGGVETGFPYSAIQTASVADHGTAQFSVAVVDMTMPLAITVSIDGRTGRFGWSPDLDMTLLDEFGDPFLFPNPFYPLFSDIPELPTPGTSSTCPAGEDCGLVGSQETIHIQPWADRFIIEIYPFEDRPNRGKGGSFLIELSNGYFDGPLVANAGPDITVTDDDGDGSAEVTLDGRATTGYATSYQWSETGSGGQKQLLGEGATVTVTLGAGSHAIELSTSDDVGSPDVDTVNVTVELDTGDGGGGGGGNGGGKPCNPRKEVCG
jgi:serine protease AprX